MQVLGLVMISKKTKFLLKYRLKKFQNIEKWGWAESSWQLTHSTIFSSSNLQQVGSCQLTYSTTFSNGHPV